MRLHGIPKNIISYKDAKFTYRFLKDLFAGLVPKLALSTNYYPHKDGQKEMVNMIHEDTLRIYVMHQQRKWEEYFTIVEFAYNNGY